MCTLIVYIYYVYTHVLAWFYNVVNYVSMAIFAYIIVPTGL